MAHFSLAKLVYFILAFTPETTAKDKLLAKVQLGRDKPVKKPDFPGFGYSDIRNPRFPGTPPQIWNVQRYNPDFTGREEFLVALRKSLVSGNRAMLTQALTGLGGLGKTQIAIEYAHRNSSVYSLVWWIRADNNVTMDADFDDLAGELKLLERGSGDLSVTVKAVLNWLRKENNWLLIFDNACDLRLVKKYLPDTANGHILLTSRDIQWRGVARNLPVDIFLEQEAVDFLLKGMEKNDGMGAARLAKELGYLPLALEQAKAYIFELGISFDDYLKLFEVKKEELLSAYSPVYTDPTEVTVATTWEMSFQQVHNVSLLGIGIMNLCSFIAPDNIPVELLREGAKYYPEYLAVAAGNPQEFNKALAALRRFSLAKVDENNLSFHRLVQAVTRHRLEEDKKMWFEIVLHIISTAFPFDIVDVQNWTDCSKLLPHALEVNKYAEKFGVVSGDVARLLNQTGAYLRTRAEFEKAKSLLERALKINEAVYGSGHPEVAISVNNLGGVLKDLWDLVGAKACYKKALKISEAAYGPDHPTVALYVNNLGSVLQALVDLAGAKACYERALRINGTAYGPDHPTVAINVCNLGSVMEALRDLRSAKVYYEWALKIDEVVYGPDHPIVAIRVNNLGGVLEALGDLVGAKASFERALKIDETVYGPDHPMVAISVNNLGGVLQTMKDLAGAKASYERALKINEAAYGPDHPRVAINVNNLGEVLKDRRNFVEAKVCFERALKIDEAVYGPDHPEVAIDVNNLGGVLQVLDDLAGAKASYERALKIDEAVYGLDHPNVATSINNLGGVLEALGDLAGAKASYEKALQINEAAYGPNHPNVAIGVDNLGRVLEALGDLAD